METGGIVPLKEQLNFCFFKKVEEDHFRGVGRFNYGFLRPRIQTVNLEKKWKN